MIIDNVNVVPMTTDTIIRNASVLVRDGRVVSIARAGANRSTAGATVIDARGQYLMPGLSDMHAHLFSDDAFPDSLAGDELAVMLANGVTATRLMIGTPEHRVLRSRVKSGALLGPQLWIAGPQLAGRDLGNTLPVTTPEQARAAVQKVKADSFDFVKVTLFITPDVYHAIVAEAAVQGIPVVGHVEPTVGLEAAFKAKQQIEHLDAYLETVLADNAPSRNGLTQGGVFRLDNWRSIDHVDERKIQAIAGATARAGIWSGPTLNVFNDAFARGPSIDSVMIRPEWSMFPRAWRDGYVRAHARYWAPVNDSVRTRARRDKYIETRNRLVKAIADSGGRILVSSDTPEWFHLYGYGVHRELQALVDAGLTPYRVLTAATRDAAEYLGATREWGTIEPGKRADLVLVRENPLASIRNASAIEGVAIGGRWLSRQELDRMLAQAKERMGR